MGDNDSFRVYFEPSHVPAEHASVIYRHIILEMEIWALETLKAVGVLVSAWHANHCIWHLNPIIFATMHFHEYANIKSEGEKEALEEVKGQIDPNQSSQQGVRYNITRSRVKFTRRPDFSRSPHSSTQLLFHL